MLRQNDRGKPPSIETTLSFYKMRRRLYQNLHELEQVVASGYMKYLSPEMTRRIMAIVEGKPRP